MTTQRHVYLLLMQMKGFQNRTFLLIKQELPSKKDQLLMSVQFSKHRKRTVKEVKQKWAKGSRGKKGRLRKGIELATLHRCKFEVFDETKVQ